MNNLKISAQNSINYLLIFTAFMSGWIYSANTMFELRFSYIAILIVLLYWLMKSKMISINNVFIFIFFIIILTSFYNVFQGNDTAVLVSKQMMGILLNAVVFYLLLKFNKFEVGKLFNIYLNIALVVGAIGIFQEVSFLIHFERGYDFFNGIIPGWRLATGNSFLLRTNSIMREPSGYAVLMMPAFFVSLTSIFGNSVRFISNWKSLAIILSVILTFSTVGFFGVGISFLLLLINNRNVKYLFISIVIILVSSFLIYNSISEVKRRIDDSIGFISGQRSLSVGAINVSSFAFFSNAMVAFKSFSVNPIFGSGLGSHELSYHKYIGNIIGGDSIISEVSVEDANSLFLRLLSETGLLGISLVFIFLIRFYISKNKDNDNYSWAINNGILVLFLLHLMRVGHYFEEGLFFFFWMYYFSKKNLFVRSKQIMLDQELEL